MKRLPSFLLCVFTVVSVLSVIGGPVMAQDTKPDEEITGSGGHLLRYSSKQVTVSLTDQQQSAFAQARDHLYSSAHVDDVLAQAVTTLKQQGYTDIGVDHEFHMVEGRHDETLVSKGREVLRGLLKSRMGLPGRPDHQATEVLISAMPEQDGHAVLVRTRFRITVWDSNGDSKTTIESDPVAYSHFYAGLTASLSGAR